MLDYIAAALFALACLAVAGCWIAGAAAGELEEGEQ